MKAVTGKTLQLTANQLTKKNLQPNGWEVKRFLPICFLSGGQF
jgi:fructose-bisphosphate aldolase class 1